MSNLTVSKIGAKAVAQSQELMGRSAAKTAPSKFDSIRSELVQKVASGLKLPPAAVRISAVDRKRLENDLRKRLSGTSSQTPKDVFRVEMKNTRLGIQSLNQAVNKLPAHNAFAPVRDRLTQIEAQFKKSGDLINNMKDMDPQALLKVQMQLYELSGNIELVSKLVDQASSGIKTVMQTQV
jgi:hypothetical protein